MVLYFKMTEWINANAFKDLNLLSKNNDYKYLSSAFRPGPMEQSKNINKLCCPTQVDNLHLKCCNVKNNIGNTANLNLPYLPSPVAHLHPLVVQVQVPEIHPSWFRILLDTIKIRKYREDLQRKNRELRSCISIIESDLLHR